MKPIGYSVKKCRFIALADHHLEGFTCYWKVIQHFSMEKFWRIGLFLEEHMEKKVPIFPLTIKMGYGNEAWTLIFEVRYI